jgi:hypothetical protein
MSGVFFLAFIVSYLQYSLYIEYAKNKTLLEGLQKKLVFEQDKAKESLLDESNLTD